MTNATTAFEKAKALAFANGDFDPVDIAPITFKLAKDGTTATLFSVLDYTKVPEGLLRKVYNEFNFIVEEGQTYPHHEIMDYDKFLQYWFYHYVAILVQGEFQSFDEIPHDADWDDLYLADFYVKPNYIGRCSHVCNAGFKVSHLKRGKGLGKEMGRKFLDIAPLLGYTYVVFNLVFETNVASIKIWKDLGFEQIGYVKNVASLKGYDNLVGAIMFGKDLV